MASVVIALIALVLGWATWLESRWGTAAVQFGVYQATWFALLLGLLGLNVLSAALVRFPWRKKQTGFLLVHAGILLLLVGCWLTRQGGVDGQMSLFEGQGSSTVLESDMHFELAIVSEEGDAAESTSDDKPQTLRIPFRPGPFNWDDYRELPWFPWTLVKPEQGVLFDRDGVKLEVLDYYSDSRRVHVPELTLRAAHGASPQKTSAGAWETATLAIRALSERGTVGMRAVGPRAVGDWRELSHGEIVMFDLAEDKAETAAFLDSSPVGPLGRWGQIVIHAGGEKHHLLLEDLLDGRAAALGESSLTVELLEFDRERLEVALAFFRVDKTAGEEAKSAGKKRVGMLVLHGLQSNLDRQDHKNGLFGSYWFDADAASADETDAKKNAESSPVSIAARRPRLDILQGHDEKLYYRAWRSLLLSTGELPLDGGVTAVFPPGDENGKANGAVPLSVYVESFTPSPRPGMEIRPQRFSKDGEKTLRVKLRLTVGGASREFWLAAGEAAESDDERRQAVAEEKNGRRSAAVQLAANTLELGFRVVLKDFQRRLDPGTSRPAGYASRIGFVQKNANGGDDADVLQKDIVVSLNSPADFTDPGDGRTYRFFQAAFAGPYRVDDLPLDATREGADDVQEEIFRSTFAVSSDPGRQLKYAGCLMIVAGIVVMYYMRAYFFGRRGRV